MTQTGSITDRSPSPRCRDCGYDLTGLRVEESCPECGSAIWPTPAELIIWANQEGKTLSDAFWLTIAALPFWLLFPPLGLLVNVAAVHAAYNAIRIEASARRSRRRRARVVMALSAAEAVLGLLWSWIWFFGVFGV